MAWLLALSLTLAGVQGARVADRSPTTRSQQPGHWVRALPAELGRRVLDLLPGPPWAVWFRVGTASLLQLGPEPREFELEWSFARKVSFFPSGERAVVVGERNEGAIWHLGSQVALHQLRHDPGVERILDVQIFPRGDRLVTLDSDCTAIIWDATSGDALMRVAVSTIGQHHAVRVFAGGSRLLTGVSEMEGDPAAIWDTADGRPYRLVRQPVLPIAFLEVFPCGTRFLTADQEENVYIWSVEGGQALVTWAVAFDHGPGYIFDLAISRDGADVVVSADGNGVLVWSSATGELRHALDPGPGSPIVELLSNGSLAMLTRSPEHGLAIVDTNGGIQRDLLGASSDAIEYREIDARDGVIVACGGSGDVSRLTAWDSSTGSVLQAVEHHGGVPGPCYAAVGPRMSMLGALTA